MSLVTAKFWEVVIYCPWAAFLSVHYAPKYIWILNFGIWIVLEIVWLPSCYCDVFEQNIVTILKTLYCEPVVKVLVKGGGAQAAWAKEAHTLRLKYIKSLGAKKSFVTGSESFPKIPDYFRNGPEKTPPKFCAGYYFWVHQPSTGGLAEIITYQ